MLLAYIDESGNTGPVAKRGSTGFYSLGCVLVESDNWATSFDQLIDFRRSLKTDFGVPVRAEIKANYLIRSSGPLRPMNLAASQRKLIYRYHLDTIRAIRARAFSVVLNKTPHDLQGPACRDLAWETLIQRLERVSHYEKSELLITHDEGEDDAIRRAVRKARRHLSAGSAFGGPQVKLRASRFLDDPVPRDSSQSYFLQLADLVAYAGWRTKAVPGPAVQQVVPQMTWDRLGPAIHRAANKYQGNDGIVYRS